MRILHLIPSIKTSYGGPATAVFDQVEALRALGHKSEIVSMDVSLDKKELRNETVVHILGERNTNFGYSRKLAPWIAENAQRFDVAIVHGVWTYISAWGSKFLSSNQLPYVLFPHGMLDPYFKKEKPLKHLLKQIFWIFQGQALHNAHSVFFTNDTERRLADRVFIGPKYNSKIVPLGVSEPPSLSEAFDGAMFRNHFAEVNDAPYILFLSRIHPKKGLEDLIEAFNLVAKEFPKLKLVIAGPAEPDYLAALKHRSTQLSHGSRIIFIGPITGSLKWSAYKGAEAFCLWTHQENFGIVLVEAMASSTPVLTTNKTNIWNILEESGGAMIGEDTSESAVEVLRTFLLLPQHAKKIFGQNARRGYDRAFSIDATSRILEKNLLNTISENNEPE